MIPLKYSLSAFEVVVESPNSDVIFWGSTQLSHGEAKLARWASWMELFIQIIGIMLLYQLWYYFTCPIISTIFAPVRLVKFKFLNFATQFSPIFSVCCCVFIFYFFILGCVHTVRAYKYKFIRFKWSSCLHELPQTKEYSGLRVLNIDTVWFDAQILPPQKIWGLFKYVSISYILINFSSYSVDSQYWIYLQKSKSESKTVTKYMTLYS